MIAKDCAAQFVEGWDWMVPVPDRGTGLWDDVSIAWTGPVLLQVLIQPVHDLNATQGLLNVTHLIRNPDDCMECNVTCQEVGQTDSRGLQECATSIDLLPQDLYVYSERVTEHTALSKAARVRSEVTLVNNSGRRWQGTLCFALQLDSPEQSSPGPLKHAQPSGQHCQSADSDLDKTRGRQQQSLDSMAERGQSRRDDQYWSYGMDKQKREETCSTSQRPILREDALHWTEAVEVPLGRTFVDIKDQVLRSPQLWWPINLGKQVRLGIVSQHVVLPLRFQESCACSSPVPSQLPDIMLATVVQALFAMKLA